MTAAAVALAPARARVIGSVVIAGSAANDANRLLVDAWRSRGLDVELSSRPVAPGDPHGVVLGRLDVLPSLDGVEPGLLALLLLERGGARLLNGAAALLTAHDKLLTARRLARSRLPHPRTLHLRHVDEAARLHTPVVLKPRFGSWGRDVFRCRDRVELVASLDEIACRQWFRRHGVLAQELVTSTARDLRVIVAGGVVVGIGARIAAPGEWRTNISLGGSLEPAVAGEPASAAARAAAAAIGADLVGVDLLETPREWVVLELNGAVEFDERYALPGRDIYADVASALRLTAV